jgi:hypothetical protein
MNEMTDDEFMQIMLQSGRKGYEAAVETAIRTGTSLVVCRKGKIVEVKPPYKYVLVPIKSKKKKRSKSLKK